MGRVDNPQPGNAPTPVAPARPAINPADIPGWQTPSTKALEGAAQAKLPLVIYFPGEGDTDASWYGKDLVELAKNNAVFIRIPLNMDREKAVYENESPIPVSKLLSENPSRDYGVAPGKPLVLVADSWGNEYFRLTKPPAATELKAYITKVGDKVESAAKKLQKNLDAAKAAMDKGDKSGALKAMLKNFKEDVVGMNQQEETVRLYHSLMDGVRTEAAELAGKGAESEKALKALKAAYRGTDAAKDIDAALQKIKG